MKAFNDNWTASVFQLVSSVLVVCFVVVVILIFSKSKEEVTPVSVAVSEDTLIHFDEGIDISDRVVTYDYEQPRQFVLQGEPRMVSPEAIIDFSGDKVTYSGDLPVDEAAKIFFDAVMGYVKEAKECKDESK